MSDKEIPYKTYLTESEVPTAWYNLRADMKKKPAPLLNPGTLKPVTAEELEHVFCKELVRQELDDTTPFIPIPEEVQKFYRMFRPSPLIRAYFLERALGTPAKIYYKFEGNNTSGSHKLNSAVAQAYYAKAQGLKGVTTETGAGQWGTALSMACAFFGLDCQVYMVKCSYEQKPFRREVMRTYGANVTPSPSMKTNVGRAINEAHPGTTGSLVARLRDLRGGGGGRLAGGLPLRARVGARAGAAAPVDHRPGGEEGVRQAGREAGRDHRLRGRRVEPRRPDRAVHGREAARRGGLPHHCRGAGELPVVHARTLRLRLLRHGQGVPAPEDVHARARLHPVREPRGRPPLPWHERHALGAVRPEDDGGARGGADERVRGGGAVREGILPAPESSHAIRVAIDEALRCKEEGKEETILFGLTGTGYFDMVAYEKFNDGSMCDYLPTDADLEASFAKLPKV